MKANKKLCALALVAAGAVTLFSRSGQTEDAQPVAVKQVTPSGPTANLRSESCSCKKCECTPCKCGEKSAACTCEKCECAGTAGGKCRCGGEGGVYEIRRGIEPDTDWNSPEFMALPYEFGYAMAVRENLPLVVCLSYDFERPGYDHVIVKLPADPKKADYYKQWTGTHVVLEPKDGAMYPAESQSGCQSVKPAKALYRIECRNGVCRKVRVR